ncbi:hypothetical protein B0H19DRAFT_1055684 [Mycena capillaripes]|nr:hypothetical protein B0H19DRAFT_1055684 [Mycena capillaripes]
MLSEDVSVPHAIIPTFPFTSVSFAALRNIHRYCQVETPSSLRSPRSPNTGHKRGRDDHTVPGEPNFQRRRTGDVINPRTSKPLSPAPPQSTSHKNGRRDWKITSEEVQEEAKGLQRAFSLHICICMNSMGKDDVPRHLSPEYMATFAGRFATADDVTTQVSQIMPDSVTSTAKVYADFLRNAEASGGEIAEETRRIGDSHLRVIFNAIAAVGLSAFAPDIFGNEESLYNFAHEHLAIHTFRTIAMAWAYTSLYIFPMPLLDDYSLLRNFYRSHVYGYMGDLAREAEYQAHGR